jgi:hypothetical protein
MKKVTNITDTVMIGLLLISIISFIVTLIFKFLIK